MKTAEEFKEEFLNKKTFGELVMNNFYEELMIEFAKYHVEKALEHAIEYAEIEVLCQHGYGILNNESILDAYPPENIK